MNAEANAKKPIDKSRRAVILATVGIVVILGLAVIVLAVVVPLRETHAVVRGYSQSEAVARLGGPERAARRLVTYLRLPRWLKTDRAAAADILGWTGLERAVPALIKALGDSEDRVRAEAAGSLGWNGLEPEVVVPTLAGALVDTDVNVRVSAAWALACFGPEAKEAVPALVKALGDSDVQVRWHAASALGRIGPEAREAVPALEKLAADADSDVRQAAAAALKKIRGEPPAPDAPEEAP